jgi:hypothetical protein
MSDADKFAEYIQILDNVDVEKIDFSEIGRMVLASLLRRSPKPDSMTPDADGFVKVSSSIGIAAKFHVGGIVPDCCCICEVESDDTITPDIIICRGPCCEVW